MFVRCLKGIFIKEFKARGKISIMDIERNLIIYEHGFVSSFTCGGFGCVVEDKD